MKQSHCFQLRVHLLSSQPRSSPTAFLEPRVLAWPGERAQGAAGAQKLGQQMEAAHSGLLALSTPVLLLGCLPGAPGGLGHQPEALGQDP